MKIPLSVESFFGSKKPVLYGIVSSNRYRFHRHIKAFVDTGSPFTMFNEAEARLSSFPFSSTKHTKIINFGSYKVKLFSIGKITIIIRDDKDKIIRLEHSPAYFIQTTKRDKKAQTFSFSAPNIIGVDFLTNNKLGLNFNPAIETAFLEG